MFSIFRPKKPFLKDFTVDFIDIHSHVLFGIDDGAKTLEDTEYLLQSFRNLGFKKVITTPHTYTGVWDNSYSDITSQYQLVKQSLPELTTSLEMRVASEYLLDDLFIQRFQSEKLLTLKDDYVLVEMSYINAPIQLYDIIFELQVAGYKPVLAHPERYLFFHHNLDEYRKLKTSGCLFQINLLSVMGFYGDNVTKAADQLLGLGLIDFAGSDVHNKTHIRCFDSTVKIKNINALKQAIENNRLFE